MQQLKSNCHNSLLFTIICLGLIGQIQSQCDASKYSKDTLYYSVKNVVTKSLSIGDQKSNTNKELKTFSASTDLSTTFKADNFLIPFIINQIDSQTCFGGVIPIKDINTDDKKYYVIDISINNFNTSLEYQFYLKEISHKDTIVRSSSFFINPENIEYQNIIVYEIDKIFNNFGGGNSPPQAKIRIDGIQADSSANYFRSHLDTIFLDGSSSEDPETPKKLLKYKWEAFVKNKNTTWDVAYLKDFNFEADHQNLVIKDPGNYKFSLLVSDGVSWSVKDSVKLKVSVIRKPHIELNPDNYTRISQHNFFSNFENRIYEYTDISSFKVDSLDKTSELKIRYLFSTDESKVYQLDVQDGEKRGYVKLDSIYKNIITPTTAERKKKCFLSCAKVEVKCDTVAIQGLRLYTKPYDTIDKLQFNLSRKIKPGDHRYLILTDYKDVHSNYDTLLVSFKQKSSVSLLFGYDRFKVWRGTEVFDRAFLDIFRFGIKGYISQKLFAEADFIVPLNTTIDEDLKVQDMGTTLLMGKVGYDIFPWKLSKMNKEKIPWFLSGYIGGYQLTVSDEGGLYGVMQYGVGGKFRLQLAAKNYKAGTIYLEAESGYYTQFADNPYKTWTAGFNIVYGIWNY